MYTSVEEIQEATLIYVQIRKCFALVKSWRERTSEDFPCPDAKASLDCVAHEVGEIFDAYLREFHPDLKRNGSRIQNVWDEICDSAFMLCTAMLEEEEIVDTVMIVSAEKIAPLRVYLHYNVGMALLLKYTERPESTEWVRYCIISLAGIVQHADDEELISGVAMRLERIERRNGFVYDESFVEFYDRVLAEHEDRYGPLAINTHDPDDLC